MTDLFVRSWPVANPKGAVAIVHGLAEHSGRYEHVGAALNAAGYAAIALDHRGHGRSPGFPADMGGSVQQIVDDVVALCAQAHAIHPRTFLLGHSMGTIFSLAAEPEVPSGTLAGLVLSGIAIQPGAAVLAAIGQPEPSLPPELVSRSPEVVQAYVDDPLVFKDLPQPLIAMLLESSPRAVEAIGKVMIPVLLLHGTADQLCDIAGAHQAYAELIVTDKTVKAYEGLYHEVLNEPERETVIRDLIAWLDAH